MNPTVPCIHLCFLVKHPEPTPNTEKIFAFGICTQRFVLAAGGRAGVDSVWEQKKLEARKMFEKAAESPASSARFVRRFCY